MHFEEALDVLTNKPGVEVTSDKLFEATNCLQNVSDELAIPALATISFDPCQDSSRREAALVLLRTRLLIWNPPPTSPIKDFIEQGLAKSLVEVQSPQLIWRIASVISAVVSSVDDSGKHHWERLVEDVSAHLSSERVRQSPELLYGALELVKAIFSDGLPQSLMQGPPDFLEGLFIAGLTSEASQVQEVAFPAMGAVLEAYVQKKETPPRCHDLFVHMISYLIKRLQSAKTNELDECLRLLTNVVSVVDISGPLRMVKVDVWNSRSSQMFTELLRHGTIDIWGPSGGIRGTKIVHQLCRMAAACIVANAKDENVVKTCWDYLIHHMAYVHIGFEPNDLEDLILQWELRRDDDENFSDLELADGSDDLPGVVWELLDRVITALDGKTAKALVAITTARLFKALPDRSGCGKLYAAWMVLAIFIGAKSDEMYNDEVKMGLAHWKGIVNLRTQTNPFDAYVCARIRWAAALFMNEALEHFSELLIDDRSYINEIISFAHTEKCPRVKAQCYLAFCQFSSTTTDRDKDSKMEADSYHQILSSTFQDWLIPQLSYDSMLTNCLSCTGKPFDLGTECVAMEIFLRELTMCSISSCMPHLGRLLPVYYLPILQYCKTIMTKVTEDQLADYVAEATMELYSKTVECAGAFILNENPTATELKQLSTMEEDGLFLLRSILRIHRVMETRENSAHRCLYKTGIYAQGFDRTLLQSAARAFAVVQINQVRPELHNILSIVVTKLQATDTVTVSDRISGGPTGKSVLTHDGKMATFTVNEVRGKQKTININTAAVEEQIGYLSFLGITAERIWAFLTSMERNNLTQVLADTIRQSPFGLVRKAGMEALKEVIDVIGNDMLKRAKSLDVRFNDSFGLDYDALLADDDFVTLFRGYIVRLKTGLEVGTVALKCGEGAEDSGILYAIADMLEHAKELALFVGVSIVALGQAVPEVVHIQQLAHSLFPKIYMVLSQDTGNTQTDLNADDDDDDDIENDAFGLRCDATMQVFCRSLRAFGQHVVAPFEEHLKAFFATVLVAEDISIVARTAALCIFGTYLEVSGQATLASDLVPVSLVFTRPRTMEDRHAHLFRMYVPQLAGGRPPAEVDENTLMDLSEALRKDGPAEKYGGMNAAEINLKTFDEYQPEVMKIQAACFCVGCAVANLSDPKILEASMLAVDEAFASLLNHPLATLTSRRVILDCLGCAFVKIIDRWGTCVLSDEMKVFNRGRGVSTMLSLLFPLVDDHEDACQAHNILLKWIVQPPTGFPRMNGATATENTMGSTEAQISPVEAGKIRNQMLRICQELKEDADNEDLLSDWALRYGLTRI